MSPFVRITPTARNAPPRILLNAHHVDRLQEDSKGVVVILKSAHAVEHIHIAESSHVIAHAMKSDSKAGRITLRECMERRPTHQTSFELANIRAVEPSDPGSIIRHGIDGSGRFEAFEDFETVAGMIESHASVELEKPLVTVEAQEGVSSQVEAKPPTSKQKTHRRKSLQSKRKI